MGAEQTVGGLLVLLLCVDVSGCVCAVGGGEGGDPLPLVVVPSSEPGRAPSLRGWGCTRVTTVW